MSLLQVTQSWGMAPVTSPGCCKMLPGEWRGDTAPPGCGDKDTAATWPLLNLPWGVTGWGHPCPLAA